MSSPFETFTQQGRFLSIETPLDPDVLLIDRFVAMEAISQPFRIEVDLLADAVRGMDAEVRAEQLLGKPMTITVHRDEGDRHFSGYVRRFATISRGKRFVRYRAELVPWLSLLALSSNCRPFFLKTVTDIVMDVCEEHGFRFTLRGGLDGEANYPTGPLDTKRQYCVQYRETDFNFISRLLEEEGIGYYFRHEPDSHRMMLADSLGGYQACPAQGPARLAWQVYDKQLHYEAITRWESSMQLLSDLWMLRDYHPEEPHTTVEAIATGLGGPSTGRGLRIYDYPGGYAQTFWHYLPQGEYRAEADSVVRRRMEEEEATQAVNWGTSTCPAFCAGHKITVREEERPSLDVEITAESVWLLTSVQHAALQTPGYTSGQDPKTPYENTFTCIPAETLFRPPRRTPKPVIQGPQTAKVVDLTPPEREPLNEIWSRTMAEVKLRFPWDRVGQESCWARVLQPWAGKTWGHQWIPRVGDEVMVEFLEGDPDCPVVIGSVYNAVNQPPFPLPKYQTQSGLRTRSTPDGSDHTFHMLRFEDKKDGEQVFLRSQKRLDVRALGSYYDTCGGSRHTWVGSESVGDYDLLVCGDHDVHINGSLYQEVDQKLNLSVWSDAVLDFQANHSTLVKDRSQLNAREITLEALQKLTLMVGSSVIVMDLTGITIQAPMVKINCGASANSTGQVDIEDPRDAATADTGEPGYLERVGAMGAGPRPRTRRTLQPLHGPLVNRTPDGNYTVGRNIIVDGTNPAFAGAALNDLATIGTVPRGQQLLESLDNSDRTVRIE
ncbi:MAG: type VI secretion system tip protein TssI/VgrG, partial [Acidobacteriota bacterium]